MDHQDLLAMLGDGVPDGAGGVWAELGSGEGNFTLALLDRLGPGAELHSVDRDQGALRRQEGRVRARFPAARVRYRRADFTADLGLAGLDGVLMANSLHFERDQPAVLELVHGYLRGGGRLILIEYDFERGNPWVPHPLSYRSWRRLAPEARFVDTRLLATHPSRFPGAMYAALSHAR